ncbi:hypothetical protein TVAG_416290 [Trichomonas vaginalis G3]|uniref:Uncharacterized protein n=1 Tax=Trichomonas vaginalis (strain ATCC PRA-98 / G3) TaxID=412133 RepID=A2FQ60_TRIV3|nr:hypothetical protein TVAGG3_0748480 [Trichomonas vaginalis G3]EAX92967.1 hypothetical protein TVAG_416290 [Trichomonas vaginalis G3]KAI5512357.1 hypothetical protein TVAGG3_0748480 [Trichomonas vaginalis G3]|eukprot:XP_001305897.1 hypothetical protein [Trichomonas vaginalis G3]
MKNTSDNIHLYGCAYEISLPDDSNNKSYAFECSVSQCKGDEAAFNYWRGDIKVSNLNTSYQYEIENNPAFYIGYPAGTGIMNFTTVSNISGPDGHGMSVYGELNFTKCNFLYIEVGSDVIANDLNEFSYCSIIGNKGYFIFIFKPTIIDCFFDKNTIEHTASNLISSVSPNEPFDLFLSHYADHGCSFVYESKKKAENNFKGDILEHASTFDIVGNAYKLSSCQILSISLHH